ncbi:hypothetical protein ACFL0Z_00870 [Patescibacteria group bacterium]
MEIPKHKLEEFKQIMREDYGAKMDDKEAHRVASKVLTLFSIICRKDSED